VIAAGDASRVWETLPELMHLAAGAYLGPEAADEAFDAARAFLGGRTSRAQGDRPA
jgi:hypothetical protein